MAQPARRHSTEPAPPSVTLDELAGDPSKAALLSAEGRGQLLARCAAVLAALSAASVSAPEHSTHAPVQDAPDPHRLLSVREVATATGFARSYVYELLRRGDLPAVRHKKYVRVRAAALEQWIASHEWHGRRAPTPSAAAEPAPDSLTRAGHESTRPATRVASPGLDDGGASAPEATA